MFEPQKDFLFLSKEAALASWARMVQGNRDQAERFREAPERPDFYAPIAPVFKVRPRQTGDAVLDILRGILKPDDTWLDIGAGGGRYALPLALQLHEIIAIEPSEAMRSVLLECMKDNGVQNIRIMANRWPMEEAPEADVVLMSHVGYDIEDIGPFLDAMEASARRLCVAVLRDSPPTSSADLFWLRVHGEKRVQLPSLRQFLILQLARQRLYEVRLTAGEVQTYSNREMIFSFLRQQLFIEADGEKDRILKQMIEEHIKERDGRLSLTSKPTVVGVVSWTPH